MENTEKFVITESQMEQFIEMKKYLKNKIYCHNRSIRILEQKDGNPRTIKALQEEITDIENILK